MKGTREKSNFFSNSSVSQSVNECRLCLSTDQNFIEALLHCGLVGHRLFDFGVRFRAFARRLVVAGAVTHRDNDGGGGSGSSNSSSGGGTFESIN